MMEKTMPKQLNTMCTRGGFNFIMARISPAEVIPNINVKGRKSPTSSITHAIKEIKRNADTKNAVLLNFGYRPLRLMLIPIISKGNETSIAKKGKIPAA